MPHPSCQSAGISPPRLAGIWGQTIQEPEALLCFVTGLTNSPIPRLFRPGSSNARAPCLRGQARSCSRQFSAAAGRDAWRELGDPASSVTAQRPAHGASSVPAKGSAGSGLPCSPLLTSCSASYTAPPAALSPARKQQPGFVPGIVSQVITPLGAGTALGLAGGRGQRRPVQEDASPSDEAPLRLL